METKMSSLILNHCKCLSSLFPLPEAYKGDVRADRFVNVYDN